MRIRRIPKGALRPTEINTLPQDPNGKGRGNRGPPVWMQYVDPPPGTLRQTPHRTPPGFASHHRGVRILRSFVQIVRTQLPSQAIDLAVRIGGKESDVKIIILLLPSPWTYSGEIEKWGGEARSICSVACIDATIHKTFFFCSSEKTFRNSLHNFSGSRDPDSLFHFLPLPGFP